MNEGFAERFKMTCQYIQCMGVQHEVFPDSMPFDFPDEFYELSRFLAYECDKSDLLDAIDNNQEVMANIILGVADVDFKQSVYRDLFYIYVDDMREYFNDCKIGCCSNDDQDFFDFKIERKAVC
jgi:hypothetical protein